MPKFKLEPDATPTPTLDFAHTVRVVRKYTDDYEEFVGFSRGMQKTAGGVGDNANGKFTAKGTILHLKMEQIQPARFLKREKSIPLPLIWVPLTHNLSMQKFNNALRKLKGEALSGTLVIDCTNPEVPAIYGRWDEHSPRQRHPGLMSREELYPMPKLLKSRQRRKSAKPKPS